MTEAATKKYVATEEDGKVASRRYHLYDSCSTLRTADSLQEVSDREVGLLGLKGCSVCEKRSTGGPAVDAIVKVLFDLGEGLSPEKPEARDTAFSIIEGLKECGFYIAQRKTKDAE